MNRCEPCEFRNENAVAIRFCITCQESQCKTCAEIHNSSKATRSHLLVDIAELKNDCKTKTDIRHFQNCNDHPEKQAEFFCIDHEHRLCSSCLLNIDSLKCKDIVDLETAGEQLIMCKFDEQVMADLDNVIEHCKVEVKKIENITKCSRNERERLKTFIDDLKQKMVTVFDKCESDILKEVGKGMEAQTASLNAAQKCMMKTQHDAEEDKRFLQTVISNGANADIFRATYSIIQQLNGVKLEENTFTANLFTHSVQLSPEFDALCKSIDTTTIMQCSTKENTTTFTQFVDTQTKTRKFLNVTKQVTLRKDNISDLSYSSADAETEESSTKAFEKYTCEDNRSCAEFTDDKFKSNESVVKASLSNKGEDNIQIIHTADVTISTPDGKRPNLVDVVTLNDDSVVLSDTRWSRLIRLNQDLTFRESTDLWQTPGNMTVLNDKFLVVCLPTVYRIAFVFILPEFRWIRNFITTYQPRSVHAVDGKSLLVSMVKTETNEWFVQLLSTDGVLLQDIGKSRLILDAGRISSIKVSPTTERTYIQCCKKSNALYCFKANGTDVFRYEVMSPNGLFVDNAGKMIFVLGSSGDVLHILSVNGSIFRTVDITGRASGITCSRKTPSLFILKYGEPKVGVFKIIRSCQSI